jgi:hypothetical protein
MSDGICNIISFATLDTYAINIPHDEHAMQYSEQMDVNVSGESAAFVMQQVPV